MMHLLRLQTPQAQRLVKLAATALTAALAFVGVRHGVAQESQQGLDQVERGGEQAESGTRGTIGGEGQSGPATSNDSRSAQAHRFGRSGAMRPAWDLFGFAKEIAGEATEKSAQREPFPFLPGEDTERSVSVGTVSDGYLVGGARLEENATIEILPRQRARGLRYGTNELIALLNDAARNVHRGDEAPRLQVGNIGEQYGGDIPYSVSHNSGRDADLAFFATDPLGNPVPLPDLLRFDDDGRSMSYGGFYRFDVARNWSLVQALIESEHAQIQYLFVSNGLREMLLDHAATMRAPVATQERAARLLRQPGAAIPHNDHFHVRVYCSAFDVSGGCEHTGAVHPGVDLHRDQKSFVVERAETASRSEDPEHRVLALKRLRLLEARRAGARTVEALLDDENSEVRAEAVSLGIEWSLQAVVRNLNEIWEQEETDLVRERMLASLHDRSDAISERFLIGLLDEPVPATSLAKPYDLRLAVVDALAQRRALTVVDALIPLLNDDSYELRARTARALRLIANVDSDSIDWRESTAAERSADAVESWNRWLAVERYKRSEPEEWLRAGFEAAGYSMTSGSRANTLARAAGDSREFIRLNAQRTLMDWSGNRPDSMAWSRADARVYWTRWVQRNPWRFR